MSEEKKGSSKMRGDSKSTTSASTTDSGHSSRSLLDDKDGNEHPSGLSFQQYRDMFMKHADHASAKKAKFGATGLEYLRKL